MIIYITGLFIQEKKIDLILEKKRKILHDFIIEESPHDTECNYRPEEKELHELNKKIENTINSKKRKWLKIKLINLIDIVIDRFEGVHVW